jgi:hypothetical protein
MDALFDKESTKLYEISKKLGSSSDILVSVKGFDDKALNKLYKIKDELKELELIGEAKISLTPSKKMKDYVKKNYYLFAEFKNKQLDKYEVKEKLQKIYKNIYSSVIYSPVDANDPMKLFDLQKLSNEKYLKLEDYGYILKASPKTTLLSADEATQLYNKINSITDKYISSISFAPFYFLVEN